MTFLKNKERAALSRRGFFGVAGGLAGVAIIGTSLPGCTKEEDDDQPDSGLDLGMADLGLLNYAFALEQLEAAFYTQVAINPYTGMTPSERVLLTDIRDHECAHREFFRATLGGQAIMDLEFNFSLIDFTDRISVLTTARTFEDLGVSAYNGAGKLLESAANLAIAGKIVSVEARHAAYIRELLEPNSFADETILDSVNRLDVARNPLDVLGTAQAYFATKLNGNNLPAA